MQNELGRPSVAILIDYIDASKEILSIAGGSSALYTHLLDVERMEVVKGTQALLYGLNAFCGEVHTDDVATGRYRRQGNASVTNAYLENPGPCSGEAGNGLSNAREYFRCMSTQRVIVHGDAIVEALIQPV